MFLPASVELFQNHVAQDVVQGLLGIASHIFFVLYALFLGCKAGFFLVAHSLEGHGKLVFQLCQNVHEEVAGFLDVRQGSVLWQDTA